jgi:hypothetical protein
MLYALTDFLVVIGVGVGILALWPVRRDFMALGAMIGLGLFGIAAMVGTIRFATGREIEWALIHGLASDVAASTGLLLLFGGLFRVAVMGHRKRTLDQITVLASLIGPTALVLDGAPAQIMDLIPMIAIGLALVAIIHQTMAARWARAGEWTLLVSTLILLTVFVGGSRDESLFGIARWHVYHAGLGIWAAAAGLAYRRVMRR